MKGLAEAKGVTTELPRISVASRIARKHYGTKCFIACEESDRRAYVPACPHRPPSPTHLNLQAAESFHWRIHG